MTTEKSSSYTLRQLPLAARLCLAMFLISVGLGYFSALINLHFQEASPGEPLPTNQDVLDSYHGKRTVSQIERLLTATETKPFNGQGSMRAAFTKAQLGGAWSVALRAKAKEMGITNWNKATQEEVAEVTQVVKQELDGERRALIAWSKVKDETARQKAYEEDRFKLEGDLANAPLTGVYSDEEANEGSLERYAKVRAILNDRCVRCHKENDDRAGRFSLQDYDRLATYLSPESPSGKSLTKLALSTHVHLLAFSMLYSLTGLIFAFTSYPGFMRAIIAPLPLVAQVIEIGCWWLARLDAPLGPQFAALIPVGGGIVAVGLGLQILLGLYNLFGGWGKFILVVLLINAGVGAYFAKTKIIDPFIQAEKHAQEKLEQPDPIKPRQSKPRVSPLERLLQADPTLPFNGEGQMRAALMKQKVGGWISLCKKKAEELGIKKYNSETSPAQDVARVEQAVQADLDGERLALIAWSRQDDALRRKTYEEDKFELKGETQGVEMDKMPITGDFVEEVEEPKQRVVKIKEMIDTRCVRCHKDGGSVKQFPLGSYDELSQYLLKKPVQKTVEGKSKEKPGT